MTNDVATTDNVFGGAVSVVDEEALARSLEDTQDEGGRMGDVSFISFSGKMGRYKIGVDGRSPNEEELWLVNIAGFELGWMCWKGGKPEAKRMANVSAPRVQEPDKEEFGPFDENRGEGWSRARAITVRSIESGEQGYFSNNSKSGVAVMSDLQKEVTARLKSGQPAWPIIMLGMEEFESNGFKNFKPIMDPIQWLSTEEVQELAKEGADPQAVLDGAGGGGAPVGDAPKPKPRRSL